MTVLDLIKSSLRLIGQLGPGRAPNASETADALFVLNGMIEAWNTESLAIYNTRADQYPLTAGKQSYTIGTGGEINAPRPVQIERANVVLTMVAGPDYSVPLELLTDERWSAIPVKALQSSIPRALYYDNAYPLANISLYPVPTTTPKLELATWQQLTGFATSSDTVAFPPGYADAIRYNLAVRLAPEWGKVPRPDVLALAVDSLAKIKTLNGETPELRCDPAVTCNRSAFNILTGR